MKIEIENFEKSGTELLNDIIRDYLLKDVPYSLYYEESRNNLNSRSKQNTKLLEDMEEALNLKLRELEWTPQIGLGNMSPSMPDDNFKYESGNWTLKAGTPIALPKEAQAIMDEYRKNVRKVNESTSTEKGDSEHFKLALAIQSESPYQKSNVNNCLARSFASFFTDILKHEISSVGAPKIVDQITNSTYRIIEANSRYIGMGEQECTIKVVCPDTDAETTWSIYSMVEKSADGDPKYLFID